MCTQYMGHTLNKGFLQVPIDLVDTKSKLHASWHKLKNQDNGRKLEKSVYVLSYSKKREILKGLMVKLGLIIIFTGSIMQLIKTRKVAHTIQIDYITKFLNVNLFCTINYVNSNCLKKNQTYCVSFQIEPLFGISSPSLNNLS